MRERERERERERAYGIQANIIDRKIENGGNGLGVRLELAPTLTKTDRHAVMHLAHVFKERGCAGGGKGYLGSDEIAFTLSTSQDQTVMQPILFGFDSLSSNSMKSKNPHSGCHIDNITKTLDTSVPCPSKNQGGNAVVFWHDMPPTLETNKTHAAMHETIYDTTQVASPVNGSNPKPGDPCHALAKGGHAPLLVQVGLEHRETLTEFMALLEASESDGNTPIAFGWQNSSAQGDSVGPRSPTLDRSKTPAVIAAFSDGNDRQSDTLTVGANQYTGTGTGTDIALHQKVLVRRLTPLECERLQGFPDGYTDIPWVVKNRRVKTPSAKPFTSDSKRYAALGNSMTTNVMLWLGQRVQSVVAAQDFIEML